MVAGEEHGLCQGFGQVGGGEWHCRGGKLLPPLPLRVQGKKKHSVVQNSTASCFFIFIIF